MRIDKTGLFQCALMLLCSACGDLLGLEAGTLDPDVCSAGKQCAPDEVCFERKCLPSCLDDLYCKEPARCEQGACVPEGDDECLPGRERCAGLQPQVCTPGGTWAQSGDACPTACTRGHCWTPPSCQTGGEAADSACIADWIPGGTFEFPYQEGQTQKQLAVSVRPVVLDRFEVTSGRFRHFLDAYDQSGRPDAGAGAQSEIAGSGWRPEWNDDPTLMPPRASSLIGGIRACGGNIEQPNQPMTCVNWYLAQAFCIWDGGRLPTEQEWTFAAMGGDTQRPYPWSAAQYDASIDRKHACYKDPDRTCGQPDAVGTYPLGAGKWNSLELAGNVSEWVLDPFRDDPSESACDGQCDMTQLERRRAVKGGSFAEASPYLLNANRVWELPERRDNSLGLRCARNSQ